VAPVLRGSCKEIDEGRTIAVANKGGQMFNYTSKEPCGVVGDHALELAAPVDDAELAPALAAGNTFVHKLNAQTPVSELLFAEIFSDEAGLPDGVYNAGRGSGAGTALTNHSDVDKLGFTESTSVSRQVAKKAAENFSPATLELGGKSPNVVFPGVDLDDAVNGVMKGIFAATGQTYLAGSRVLVHEAIGEEFVERFTESACEITLGEPMDPPTEMGPIAFREQWETAREYVTLAARRYSAPSRASIPSTRQRRSKSPTTPTTASKPASGRPTYTRRNG
jgi:aldehyde dehydrogenase (NAD+)